ncbi:transcriptional regulator GutM [Gracilibacillus alcaliphilus]|uniref:transcriptional regulator GutM n=1 Tax=Gracilibacillus alcaliphilus TaxID=1401441 RepID=UPI001957EF97|nr:transcriptional regulator GutM [Gracilibacillus alcaliphilus]MBM7676239.1 glucitol operon activator protein [Gracilibacillus alcaliphilus]
MWGVLIAVFVGIWILQLYLSWGQVKHYQKTVRKMSDRSSGYLGTGSMKRKLGIGNVVIIVADESGKIIDSKVMKGVTVFAKFTEFHELKDRYIQDIEPNQFDDVSLSIKAAIENIQAQMEKNLLEHKEA